MSLICSWWSKRELLLENKHYSGESKKYCETKLKEVQLIQKVTQALNLCI